MEIKKTAVEILSKHTGKEGVYLTRGMINGSDAIDAMEEYAGQFVEQKNNSIVSGLTKKQAFWITLISRLNKELVDEQIITPNQKKQINDYIIKKLK